MDFWVEVHLFFLLGGWHAVFWRIGCIRLHRLCLLDALSGRLALLRWVQRPLAFMRLSMSCRVCIICTEPCMRQSGALRALPSETRQVAHRVHCLL